MASYKVLQDIEAEDTLIGPLTLRQCLYAAIAVIGLYLSFVLVTKGAAFLVVFLLPFIAFGAFFAFPWSKQQTTEVWALAKIRFYLKPRKRIWNQTGIRDLVTVTVPKSLKRAYTNNLTPIEVTSRLKALADTIDSRGWAIKNVDLGYYAQPGLNGGSDRLINPSNFPQEVPGYDTTTTADIFDVQNNPIAQKFDAMMTQSADAHRQQIMQQMVQPQQLPQAAATPQQDGLQQAPVNGNLWHMRTIQPPVHNGQGSAMLQQQYSQSAVPQAQPAQQQYQAPADQPYPGYATLAPAPTAQQAAAAATTPPDYSNLRLPAPIAVPAAQAQPAITDQSRVTGPTNPAILELANNNDLNVATLAREAQARNPEPTDEVIISLH